MIVLCQRCRSTPSTGLWLLEDKQGKETVKALCGGCGLGYYPATSYKIKLLAQFESKPRTDYCESKMEMTGLITRIGEASFFELRCVTCGYLEDFPIHKVKNALARHSHEIPPTTSTTSKAPESEG